MCKNCPRVSIEDEEFNSKIRALTEACEAVRLDTEAPSEREETHTSDRKLLYLNLVIKKATDLLPGTTFEINALGYKNSDRDKKDSVTYVGHFNHPYTSEDIINDIVFPSRYPKHGQHFCISYEWSSNLYYIRDLNAHLYRKIHSIIPIRNNMLVQANNNFFKFCLKGEYLQIQYDSEVLTFCRENKIVTIGRSFQCSVVIQDNTLSRYQMSVFYRNDEWNIADGNYITKEPSKNGTWLLLSEPVRILNGMIIKCGDVTFETKLFTHS